MHKLIFDENFDARILRGVRRRLSDLDSCTVQEAGLRRIDDPDLLAWAAKERRIIITHDVNTLVGFAYERVAAKLPMSGVIAVPEDMPIGKAIEELEVVLNVSTRGELESQVLFLPL